MGEGIRAVLETMFKGYEAATIYFQNEGKPKIKKYFLGLLLLFVLTFIPSLPLIYYGIYYDSSWALVIGGIWRAFCTMLLLLAAIPIGIIFEVATGGFAGSGQRYVRLIAGVFISELLFVLIVSIIPISNNPKMFPIFILASVLLGFLGALSMNRKVVSIFVGAILVGIVLSFYLPNTFQVAKIAIRGIDLEIGKPTLLKHALNDYKTGKVEFFYPNGEPKVWYVEVDDKIELLNNKGFHTGVGSELKEINKSILEKLRKDNWGNLSPNNIIQEQRPVQEKAQPPQQVSESTKEDISKVQKPEQKQDNNPVEQRKSKSQEQQTNDRNECQKWAAKQTNYDPNIPSRIPPAQFIEKRASYKRAMEACLEGRGHTVKNDEKSVEPNQSVNAMGFNFVLSKVRRLGDNVFADLVITSSQDNLALNIVTSAGVYSGHTNTDLYDKEGNLYKPNRAILGNANMDTHTFNFSKGIPTRVIVVFSGFPPEAEVSSLVLTCWVSWYISPSNTDGKFFRVFFRNIG